MTASPVFISDLDSVKAQLRLSAVDTGDAVDVIDSVMDEVRLGLYEELGSTRIAEILALTLVSPAVTTDQLTRLQANNVELLWIRMVLMRRLPALFIQGGGVVGEAWNEEGITRTSSSREISREVRELKRTMRLGLASLKGEETGDIAAFVPVPDETPRRPGDSIYPSLASGEL